MIGVIVVAVDGDEVSVSRSCGRDEASHGEGRHRRSRRRRYVVIELWRRRRRMRLGDGDATLNGDCVALTLSRFRYIWNLRFLLLRQLYWTRGSVWLSGEDGDACDAVFEIVDGDFVDFDVFSCDD